MSGPQDLQSGLKMLGMGGGPAGPKPTLPIGMTKKPQGDDRVPMSNERPRVNPGQLQDRAARALNVPSYRVQPQERVPTPQPPMPTPAPIPAKTLPTPARPSMPAPPMPVPATPMAMPQGEVNPSPVGLGSTPMPRGRPEGAGSRVAQIEDAKHFSGMISSVLERIMQGAKSDKPLNTFPYFDVPGALGLTKPNSAASAMPSPAPSMPSPGGAPLDPFKTGAPPILGGIDQLTPIIAAAAKAKAEQSRPPVQAPEATRPSPNVTPPTPPGQPIPPPPSAVPPMGREGNPETFQPSMPNFRGYEIVKPKAEKGEEKHSNKADKKGNSPYYYTRVGAQIGDNSAVAQRLKEIREKAGNPRTAKKMTLEEDRILAQYADGTAKGASTDVLSPMDAASVKARMDMYRSGNLVGQIPDRYDARPPGVAEGDGTRTPLKLPPKTTQKRDIAEEKAKDAIQNPPDKNGVDEAVINED